MKHFITTQTTTRRIETPIGAMVAIATNTALVYLAFEDDPMTQTMRAIESGPWVSAPAHLATVEQSIPDAKSVLALIATEKEEDHTWSQHDAASASTQSILDQLTAELTAYFDGSLRAFTTPIHLDGTDFQRAVWGTLLEIPYGQTQAYSDQGQRLNRPSAQRAIANANGSNPISILVPCHRIVRKSGALGGYRGGIERKQWLIEHERKMLKKQTTAFKP
jgi:O-6-methylguanine DNA methyltransferase